MLLGNPKFKEVRQHAWDKWLDPKLAELQAFSKNWTNPENLKRLKIIERELILFRKFQVEIEDIANTIEATPAQLMLFKDAAPRAAKLSAGITKMINLEGKQQGSDLRKQILLAMADVRGSLGLGLANIRAFLLGGDPKFKANYDKLWATNSRRFRDLSSYYQHFTPVQRRVFDEFKQTRSEFESYPPQMFKIKASKEANLGNYWLASKAAPAAGKIVEQLEAMANNQNELLAKDGHDVEQLIVDLENVELGMLIAGVLAALFFAVVLTRAIAGPIVLLANTVREIAEKRDLTIKVAEGGRDEIGQMSEAFNGMMDVIRGAFGVVSEAAVSVAGSSQNVAQGAGSNRNRAEEEMKRAQTSEKVITEMGNSAGQVSNAAAGQQEAAQSSQKLLAELVDKMHTVSESADGTNVEANKTIDRVSEMGETGA
ncbi:MAG: methyl-accepting chemotaxis protein, partial [Gammaproteobacteria bacterium]|nr:methyl-accepting chemotaxis protein [Gammaproteobacteria bacterium]